MTIASAVNAAIKAAKSKMGDVVSSGTYRVFQNRTYVAGVYTTIYNDVPVDYAPDRFTLDEMQDSDYQLSDVKIIVFNTDNLIEGSPQDAFVMDGAQYNVRRVAVSKIGNFRPVVTLILRK